MLRSFLCHAQEVAQTEMLRLLNATSGVVIFRLYILVKRKVERYRDLQLSPMRTCTLFRSSSVYQLSKHWSWSNRPVSGCTRFCAARLLQRLILMQFIEKGNFVMNRALLTLAAL